MQYYGKEQRGVLEQFVGREHDSFLEDVAKSCESIEKRAVQTDMGNFPREQFDSLARCGVIDSAISKPFSVYLAALEMVAKACANTAVTLAVQNEVLYGINNFASEDLKERFVPPLMSGKKLACFALSEPGSGSDASAMKTTAELQSGAFNVNGHKTYVTNYDVADYCFLFAQNNKGPIALMFECEGDGLKKGDYYEKLGWRGTKLGEYYFNDFKIPSTQVVGEEGKGFDYGKVMLNHGRVMLGAIATGIASAAYEKSLAHALKREQFGKRIFEFGAINDKLADMQTSLTAARNIVYYAGNLLTDGKIAASECAQAKLFSTESAVKICDSAIQIHGGLGFVDKGDVHRHWRDVRATTIGEGTSEVLRAIIARFAAKGVSLE